MTATLNQVLSSIKDSMRTGEYLLAYDWALIGLLDHPKDEQLRYFAVLALARTGATDQAQAKYELYEMNSFSTLETAALGSRLIKDKALISHPRKKTRRFTKAAELYEEVFDREGRTQFYPAINAATTYHLAGEIERAQELANEVLELCNATEPSYWRYASEAEAYLLKNDISQAKAALIQASALAESDLASIAATKKQLALIYNDPEVLDTLKIPRVIHYAGHIINPNSNAGRFPADQESEIANSIAKLIKELDVGIAYGSLAAGADILFAEAVLANGGEVHVTLPFDIEDFKETSVAQSGGEWLDRFDECWAAASSQSFSSKGGYCGDDTLFDYCSLYSMGRACLRHQHLGSPLSQILVWDGEKPAAPAGTYKDYQTWSGLGFDTHIIPVKGVVRENANTPPKVRPVIDNERKLHAIVFGDIKGFSSLTDAKLPIFVSEIMGCLASVIDSMDNSVLMANTWGDGLFIVLKDVSVAAKCAKNMQKALKKLTVEDPELQEKAELRLGIHFGPVYNLKDPITKRQNFFGEHVNRAARIEPITPPRQVYVTEPFAAQLALTESANYKTEYVGYIPMAKDYGELPMYLLQEKFDD